MDVQRAVDRRRLEAQGVIFGTPGLTRVRSRPQRLGKARLSSELARPAQRTRSVAAVTAACAGVALRCYALWRGLSRAGCQGHLCKLVLILVHLIPAA